MTHGTLGPQWIDDEIGKANAMSEAPERKLIKQALIFADLAAGEGISINGVSPEEFLCAYSTVTGDEDWENLPSRVADIYDAQAKVIEGLINEAVGMADGKDEAEYIEKRLRRSLAALQESSHD